MFEKFVTFLIFSFLVFGSLSAHAGITHLANDASGGTGSSDGTTPVPITVSASTQGNLMVALVTWCCNTGVPTVSDNKGNTWTQLGSAQTDGGGDDWTVFYYAISTVGGVTSVSVGPNTNGDIGISYGEFSGVNQTSPTDGAPAAAVPSSTIADSGALTPTQTGDLLVVMSYNDTATAVPVHGVGFTSMAQIIPNTTAQGVGTEYEIDAAAAAIHGKMTWNTSAPVPTIMGAFKPAKIRHKVNNQ